MTRSFVTNVANDVTYDVKIKSIRIVASMDDLIAIMFLVQLPPPDILHVNLEHIWFRNPMSSISTNIMARKN